VEHVMQFGPCSIPVTLTLKPVCFTYFHSIINDGIFFGLHPKIVKRYFTKQGVRITVGAKCRHSYSILFK